VEERSAALQPYTLLRFRFHCSFLPLSLYLSPSLGDALWGRILRSLIEKGDTGGRAREGWDGSSSFASFILFSSFFLLVALVVDYVLLILRLMPPFSLSSFPLLRSLDTLAPSRSLTFSHWSSLSILRWLLSRARNIREG
jgi:hypothetical protein